MKLIDANVLLFSVNAAAAEHSRCKTWLEAALVGNEPIVFDWIVLLGFLRIATLKNAFRQPLSVHDAVDQVQRWLDMPIVRMLQPTTDHWTTITEMLVAVGTGGNLTIDAHLAALAICHNATLVSCNLDFARFRRLKWENPLAVP